MNKSINLILIFLILSILLIGWVTSSGAKESPFFHWIPYLWASILTFLNWLIAVKILFNEKSKNPIFGVLPAASIVLIAGSLISVILLFFNSSELDFSSNFHLISQIAVITGTLFLLALFHITFNLASIDTGTGYLLKTDSIKIINNLMRHSSDVIKDELKKIVNMIEYDLPNDSKLQLKDSWKKFSISLKENQDINSPNQLTSERAGEWINLLEGSK